ncbi:MAG: hypothetical protein KKH12_00260 [Gammaproteobacteria bacterium]|nr:hypothetical protein [Gammaproteobacteria bacterium]MBU1480085.1 hypothetical protein [Gammaproteobacteria bacterium]
MEIPREPGRLRAETGTELACADGEIEGALIALLLTLIVDVVLELRFLPGMPWFFQY